MLFKRHLDMKVICRGTRMIYTHIRDSNLHVLQLDRISAWKRTQVGNRYKRLRKGEPA